MEENQNTSENEKISIKKYVSIGLTVFLTVCACTLFFFIVYRFASFSAGWKKVMNVLQPFIIGAVIAYILNPIVRFSERKYYKWIRPRMKEKPLTGETEEHMKYYYDYKCNKLCRGLGVATAELILILLVAGVMLLLIPQLVTSLSDMFTALPGHIDSLMEFISKVSSGEQDLGIPELLRESLEDMPEVLGDWFQENVVAKISDHISTITSSIYGVLKAILNALIGIIVSSYLLAGKETYIGQTKKILYAICKPRIANETLKVSRKANDIFNNFIVGSLLDSLIIGLLTYICCLIFRIPYSVVVAVVVGITNIIPFFGPIIGAVPCFVLIALASPLQGLYFLIIIVVIQQLDGNVIKPNVLGSSVGLSSFWIIFSITVGGGLFGFMGMLVGVPVFAVIYYLIDKAISRKLLKKELDDHTDAYVTLNHVDIETKQMDYSEIEIDTRPGEIHAEEKAAANGFKKKKSLMEKLAKKVKRK